MLSVIISFLCEGLITYLLIVTVLMMVAKKIITVILGDIQNLPFRVLGKGGELCAKEFIILIRLSHIDYGLI